jgi:dihydroneopterin aldolase
VKVELHGLHVFGYHGVEEEEQRLGQLFLYDIELDVDDARGASDRIEDAVDYRDVATTVREVSERRFQLLEALASAVADRIAERFPVERVRVRVRKPQVKPAGLTVDYSAVTVERTVSA